MIGNRVNAYNSTFEKIMQLNETKNMINNKKDNIDSQEKKSRQLEEIKESINKFNYLFGSLNDVVINDSNSKILSNTGTKKKFNYSYQGKKESVNIKKSLEILNDADFFKSLTTKQSGKKLMLDTVDLHYKNMRNIKSTSSLTYLEKVYNNFKSLKEKENSLLIGFDTETIGDITNKAWSPQGMTEFAMIVNNMTTGASNEVNILLNSLENGIDHWGNYEKIKNILGQTNGLEILKQNKDLLVAAERYSMYGHKDTVIKFNEEIGFGYSQVLNFAGKEGKKIGDINQIKVGVEKLLKDKEKVKINENTGLYQDVSETLKHIGFMVQQNKTKNAMLVNYNGQSFDIPVINKFVKSIYQQQINILNSNDKNSSSYHNSLKAINYMTNLFGNSPGFNLDEDYVFDAFSAVRTAIDMFGENKVYNGTSSGKHVLSQIANHIYRQENIAEGFYQNKNRTGNAHTAVYDTRILNSFFLDNMENSKHNLPLIPWLMEGINGTGVIGKSNLLNERKVNSNQYYMATQTDPTDNNGKRIFNFIQDSNGRIITSSNHIIDTDGSIIYDKILNENPKVYRNSFYSIKNVQKIDMSKMDHNLSQLVPEYGLNNLYHVELSTVHGDKYKGTSNNSNLNLVFNSQKEMEAWFSSNFSLIGETLNDGTFKLNESAIDDYQVRQLKNGSANLSGFYNDKNDDYSKFQHLLNVQERNAIDRRVTNNFLYGDKAISRISATLDLHDFLEKNKLSHLSSIELARLYFDKNYASSVGISNDVVKNLKKNLNKNLGFEKKINGDKRQVILDSTVRNALFAYENVRDQYTFYSNLLNYSYEKNGIEFKKKENWSDNFKKLDKSQKDMVFNVYDFVMEQSNQYIALTLGKITNEDIRDVVINGKNRLESSTYFKSNYDFKLKSGFYESKGAVKINSSKKSNNNANVVSFNLDRENPRNSFISSLLKAKFDNAEDLTDHELIKYRKSTFLDFIDNISQEGNEELFEDKNFKALKKIIAGNRGDFSLEGSLDLLQRAIENVKDNNINAGLIKSNTVTSSIVSKKVKELRNNITKEQIGEFGKKAPEYINLNGNKKKISSEIDYLLKNFFMPNKNDFLNGSYKTKVEKHAANILYDNIYAQMKGAINEVFEAAGIAGTYIHYDLTKGTLNLIKDDELIALNNFPKIVEKHGRLFAKSGRQTFALKHVLDTVNIKGEEKIALRTNLDLNFGKQGRLSTRIERLMKDNSFSLDQMKREIGYTNLSFADSPTILDTTLADLMNSNNTVDFRNTDPILSHIFNANSQYRKVLTDLYLNGELNTPNVIKILEDNLSKKDTLKPGELSAVLRMISNVDMSTILQQFTDGNENTMFILQNSNALGKETRITEGNRYIGNNIFPTVMNKGDNYAKPTLVSAQNTRWIKSNTIEHTKKNYEGLLISGPVINSEDIMRNIYLHVQETGMDYQNSFSHRQLYTGVLGVNDIVHKEQERVLGNLIKDGMSESEKQEIIKTYNKAALKVRDSLFEQAKVFDPLLFEGTIGQVPQDIKKIGNGLETIIALNELKEDDKQLEKLIKGSKIVQMIDSIGSISVDENGVINYKKGKGSLVKRSELIIPYKNYGGGIDNISSPFAHGVLGFAIRDEFGNELTEKEINKILNDNVSKYSFDKDVHTNLKNLLSIFNENSNYKMGFEIENINKLESAKMFDNYAEKSMVNLFYGKTGEFDKKVERYFKTTNGNDLLYHTVLTNKALDSYINDVEKKFGTKKAQQLLEDAGLKSIEELKQRVAEEQFKYRNIIFGPKGIFTNVSGVANDDVIKHRSEGARISSAIGQAISLVGKYENDGKDNHESFEIGLSKVLDFINKGKGKYDFLSESTNSNIKEKRQNYTVNDFALLFNPKNQDDEFIFADIEKAKNLLRDLDKKFLSNAKEEDRLHHKNVKVLVGENEFETIEDYYGSLHFYKNEQGEKIAIGSLGVVNKNHAIDSEFQSNVSKEYLDRKKHIQDLKYKKDELLNNGEIDDKKIKRLERIQDRIDKEVAIVNSMSDYSRHMKIDDQARNILSNSALNTETERKLNVFMNGDNRQHYSKLLNETTNGLIQDKGDKVIISDLVRSSNVNKKIIDEIKGQITYNPLEEKLLTKDMIQNNSKYAKYGDLYEKVNSLGLKLGTQHAEIFHEGIQAHKAAEFNMGNSVSMDTLIDKYDFKYKKLDEYVSSRGRTDNEVLESLLHESLLIDLGKDFNDKRYVAVPALGRKTGTKEIRQEWHQTLGHLAKTYKEYQDLEGLENKRSTYLKGNIIDLVDKIKVQTDELMKKDKTLSNLAKVEVNMPYSRVKLMSTMSEELIKSPLAEEMKSKKQYINNIDSESFRNKAMINGKTIAELEKGGVEHGGIFFDYRLAGESEFRNAGYFDDKFLKDVMGFKKHKDENGKIIDLEEQMRRHLETHGTMDIVDRYPNIKDQSLYTGMVFLDRGIGDNVTAVAGHSLLKLNGDSDGDMLSTLFLQYKGTNFATYNKFRMDAEKYVNSTSKLSNSNMNSEEYEKRVRQQTVALSKGKVSIDSYDLFRQKQIEMVYRAFENVSNIEENLLPAFYKESARNYKGMALAITKDGKRSNLEAEVVGGKSILGKVKLFNMEKHIDSGFFEKSNKELSEYMQKAYEIFENSNIIENKKDYKYMDKLKDTTNIHEFNTEQSSTLDEILSVFTIAKRKEHGLISENEYNKIEKSVVSRIRANTYVEAEISKSGKESIGQLNGVLYPIKQASEELFGKEFINDKPNASYNPLARQVISDMSDQIEQNIISYKTVQAVAGDERLVKFLDIMGEVKKNKKFNILPGESQSDLIEWNQNYLKGSVIEKMYENLKRQELLTDSMINQHNHYYEGLLKQGMSEAEASSSAKASVLTQEYAKSVNELYGNKVGEDSINLHSNFGRSSYKVSKEKSIEHASTDSFGGIVQSIVGESPIGKDAPPLPIHRNLSNNMDDVRDVTAFKDALFNSNSKNAAAKIMQDTTKALESANSSGLAMGVLGLASGLLISGFASGNPLKNPQPQEIESSPKTEAMSVPDFFEKQGGYVTGNSQNGYILNIKADTNKGQRHMKRALKQAVKATAGGAVNINMNFKSNNNGGYSDQDIEKLINSYI